MKRGSESKINGGLVGVVLSVGAIAIALNVTGKSVERVSKLSNKSGDSLKVMDIVSGCNLDEYGAAVVNGWNHELIESVNVHLSNPRMCSLVVDQVEMLQEVGPLAGGKLQATFKQEIKALTTSM